MLAVLPRRRAAVRTATTITSALLLSTALLAAQSVHALAPLQFGTVLGGTTTSISPAGAGAMAFDLTGPLGTNGGWTITLPATLTRVGSSETMPVTFCSTCGVYRIANNNPAGGITFNPSNPVLGISLLSVIHVYVWLGGSVSPTSSQRPGAYVGTVVLTLAPII